MQLRILKYILDIETVIAEINLIKIKANNNFHTFSTDILLQRAAERDLEIIGEAVKKNMELDPQAPISSTKNIIGLRNRISHAYDSIEPEMVWSIIQKDIPLLEDQLVQYKK